MTRILGPEAKATEAADCGFFVPKTERPQRPTAEAVAAAKAAVNEFFYGEHGDTNGRLFDAGRNDVVRNQMDTDAARTYIEVEGLLGIAHSAHDRMPGVVVEQVPPEQPGGVGA